MTYEERFERIEEGLHATQAILRIVAESQVRTQETIQGLADSISKYVDAADARMRRIEENLDGLIRAITAEHTNGKGQR